MKRPAETQLPEAPQPTHLSVQPSPQPLAEQLLAGQADSFPHHEAGGKAAPEARDAQREKNLVSDGSENHIAAAGGAKPSGLEEVAQPPPRAGAPITAGASQVQPRRDAAAERSASQTGGEDLPESAWEYEGGGQAAQRGDRQVPQMRHRLRNKAAFWKTFCRSTLVLSWITVGFVLLWNADCPQGGPTPVLQSNHKSAVQNGVFVEEAIAELLATGAAVECGAQPHCVMPLGVVPKPGTDKFRLIYDARYLNQYVVTPSFKYETLSGLGSVLQPGDYLFTVDLKSGYHHLDINERFWKFLGFEWEGKYYTFTQLPFGLAPACWAFTKLTRELQTFWRSEGHRTSGYIDDSIHANQDRNDLVVWRTRVVTDLEKAGFLISEKKCDLEPTQQKRYLGALVDTDQGCLLVPEDKRAALVNSITEALRHRERCKAHAISSIVGHIMSMSYSFGELSTLMTRRLTTWQNEVVKLQGSLHRHAPLSPAAVSELDFWRTAVQRFNGRKPLWAPSYINTFTVFTDAAGRSLYSFGGWGGWAWVDGQLLQSAGRWDFETRGRSSTFLELLGVWNVLRSLNAGGQLSGQRILINTDNQGVFGIISKAGSMVPDIQDVCMELFWYAIEHQMLLLANWIPRESNTLADALSKVDSSSDWMLNQREFQVLQQRWGPFEVDLFASATNHLLPRYFSHFYTPSCAGVNAFTQVWPSTSWCNPPFSLMGRVLEHAKHCSCRMALVVPFWPGAAWWHRLVENEYAFRGFVWDCVILPPVHDLFLGGSYGNTVARRAPGWHTMALLTDFRRECPYVVRVPNL